MEPEGQIISKSDNILFKNTGQITSLLSMIDGIHEVIKQLDFNQLEQNEMLQAMQNLNTLFNYNKINIQLFMKYTKESSSNVFISLINRYLNTEKNEDTVVVRETLLTLFDFLFCYSDCGIEVYNLIFQSLSNYFFQIKTLITESKLLDHFNLLSHLYGYPILQKSKPKNYYFFGGKCQMNYQMNKNTEIKLINGFCITTWFKPLSEGIDQGKTVNIIHLKTEDTEISLTIKKSNMLSSIINSELPSTVALLPQNEWICLSMNISPSEKCLQFKVNKMGMVTQKIQSISVSSIIKSLILFENYFGEATSIVMTNQAFALQNTNNCFNKYPVGIYKMSQVNVLFEAYPLDKVLCLYTPIYSFEGKGTISDILGQSQFELINECGVHCYHSYSKKISLLGGINQLLPIMELIYTSNLMTEQTIIAYLNLIVTILNKCPYNIQDLEKSNFFSMLSLFLEKLPLNLYNNRLLDKFIEIKEIIIKSPLMQYYFKDILLNETIFCKFPINVQSILWNDLTKMAMNDINQFITYCPMNKMCLLLKCYDKNRYEEYCCQEHADLFIQSKDELNKAKIMSPTLLEKTHELTDLIEKIAKKIDLSKTQDPLVFFEFLAFDLSPCLIRAILKMLIEITKTADNIAYIHQNNTKINSILIHLLMTSLPDIKCEILSFLFIINRNEVLMPSLLNGIKSNLYMSNVFYKYRPKETISNEEIDSLANHCRMKIEMRIRDDDECENFNDKEALLNLSCCDKYNIEIYNCLLQFLFNKSIPNIQEDFHMNKNDIIVNSEIMNIIIEYSEKKKTTMKLLKDLYTVLELNKDNCIKFYSNQGFYVWLIKQMYEGYLKEDKNNEQLSLTVNINNAIIKHTFGWTNRDKGAKDPSYIFYYFFSFGIQEMKKGANTKIVNKFIHFVILNMFDFLQGLAKRSLNDSYYRCIMIFLSATIDYMTLFNLKRKKVKKTITDTIKPINQEIENIDGNNSNIESEGGTDVNVEGEGATNKEDEISIQTDSSNSSINTINDNKIIFQNSIIPACLFDGLNINSEPESDKIEDIWNDYILFEKFFNFFCQTWIQSFLKFSNKNEADYIITNNETIMENLLLNQLNKNIFSENLKELIYQKGMYTHAVNILLCFIIILTHSQNEEEISKWLNEFKIFILFNLLAASNLTNSDKTNDYQLIQTKMMDLIGFAIIFLTECHQKRTGKIKESFEVIIKIIFSLCCIIQKEIYISETNKSMLSIFKKNPVKDLYNTCVHKLFKEFFVNTNGSIILNEALLNEIKSLYYLTVPELFNNEPWKSAIVNNKAMNKRIENFFCIDNVIRKQKARFNEKINIQREETNETKYVLKTIKSIIDSRRSDWLQFTNGSFYNIKQKQLLYKKEKKKMFQWKGMWSNRHLFYKEPDQLKYKIMNHLTKSFSKPLLCPILDIDYYIPHFTNFSISQLFRNNGLLDKDDKTDVDASNTTIINSNLSYIKLNINNIFKSIEESKDDESIGNNNQTQTFKQIYLNYSEDLWNKYKKCNDQVFLRKKDNSFDLISGITQKSKDEKMKQFEKEYQCCRIKLSHHVKGVLCLNKSNAIFKVSINQKTSPIDNQNNIDYDDSRKTCFGSYFVFHHKDQDTITYTFPYMKIRYFFRRHYYHRNTALELYLSHHKSFFLNFNSSQDREEVIASINQHLPNILKKFKIQNSKFKDDYKNIIGFENMFSPSPFIPVRNGIKMKILIEAWKSNFLSNFDLLMCMNLFSNRSYSDLSQYPIFPWIITNYTDDEISLENDIRDLSLPMGMMTLTQEGVARKNLFLENYEERNNKEIADEPFYFGSHYSNPIYTTHFMTRIFPYAHIMIELQGNTFDDPNRLFLSIEGSFKSASTQKSDVRELIPEFYYLPELFININKLNLGTLANQTEANDVRCPNWSNNNPYFFIKKHREYLENEKVSATLNNWIDLIFGKKQRGKEANLANNLFFPRSYDFNVENASKEEHLRYRAEVEFGLCPNQIFTDDFPNKTIIRYKQITKGKLQFDSLLPLRKPVEHKSNILIGFKVMKEETSLTFFDNNETIINKFIQEQTPVKEIAKEVKQSKLASFIFQGKQDSNKPEEDITKKIYCLTKLKEYYTQGTRSSRPIRIKKQTRIIQGGFFDGKMLMTTFDANNKESYIILENKLDRSPISAVELDEGNGIIFGGNHEGRISVFSYDLKEKKWKMRKQLINHSKRVNYIFYSTYMNILVSSSSDGYINYYTVPLLKHFRSIYIENKSCDYVFISSSPLPSVLVISNNDNSFVSYSINGKYLKQENEDSRIKSPLVYTDTSFCDYIIYITANTIKIRAIPYLEIVNEIQIEDKNIEFIDISENRRTIFATDDEGNEILIIKSY